MVDDYKLYEKMYSGEPVYAVLCENFTYYVWPVIIESVVTAPDTVTECEVSGRNGTISVSQLFETYEEAETLAIGLQNKSSMKLPCQKQNGNMIDRETLLKRIFPLGVPPKHEMNYGINARAVYEAIMK